MKKEKGSRLTFGTAVEELAGVHAFDSDEKLSVLLVFVAVSEDDFSEGCSTAGIVHDVLDDSLDVAAFERMVRHPKVDTYPLRSAKSRVLKAAGAILLEVWALKIVLPPRLCTKIKRGLASGQRDKMSDTAQGPFGGVMTPTSDYSSHD